MDVLVDRCAGLDVHKNSITACVRSWSSDRKRVSDTRTFVAFEGALRELRDWLAAAEVTEVVMEATGVYWKPVWYTLEDGPFVLKLVNPQHVKAVSGRKTDVRDAAWLAKLCECGLLDASFVPPRPIRELRDVTRYRRRLVEDRGRELMRLQKLLEDAQVKLDSVVSDISGVTARLILDALCAGGGCQMVCVSGRVVSRLENTDDHDQVRSGTRGATPAAEGDRRLVEGVRRAR